MFTARLQKATARITVDNRNQWSTLATTARPAHPQNKTDLPTVITAICVTHTKHREDTF